MEEDALLKELDRQTHELRTSAQEITIKIGLIDRKRKEIMSRKQEERAKELEALKLEQIARKAEAEARIPILIKMLSWVIKDKKITEALAQATFDLSTLFDYNYKQHSSLDFGGSVPMLMSSWISTICTSRCDFSTFAVYNKNGNKLIYLEWLPRKTVGKYGYEPKKLPQTFEGYDAKELLQVMAFLTYFAFLPGREVIDSSHSIMMCVEIIAHKIHEHTIIHNFTDPAEKEIHSDIIKLII